ncbi:MULTISPECIES: cytosolic protein [Bacillaceae]|uniref:cytosolic protein n=1 Tax=Bacillaceae TaxID=186817 RepID=UPI002A0EF93C|nr:cytosolic protein [Cytobacillus sp. IB215316]MDX8360859.1 cytosolic protein [Cytobacillus sp. IB215316]
MNNNKNESYSDFNNVEAMKNYLVPEQLPEGPYGSPRGQEEQVENKSSSWEPSQRYYSAFNYEVKSLHHDIPRKFPGAHPPHDK